MSKIVVPGQVVSESPQRAAYTYTDGVKTYATVVSLQSEDGKLIPLEGPYEPLAEDVVVGYVTDVRFAGYTVEIGSPYTGFLSSRDTRATFRLGDIVSARIINVDEVKSIDLADGRVLSEGRIEKISAVKVPRLIGKKNSMINMIAAATGCQLIVGRNGFIFVSHAGNHNLAHQAILMIEAQAHTIGLTDRMAAFLSEATGKKIEPGMAPPPSAAPATGGYSSEGGYGSREGGRSGGFGGRREGGFGHRREGGFGGPRREGGRREGGFGGPRREGGFQRRPPRPNEGENSESNASSNSGQSSSGTDSSGNYAP
ncbi:MAG: hypothetical protein KGH63_02045, partial [Candidatus Micrarchaeota archaeon]|nr:hypothetical protein [Candidatus Micrarchaeota archaeon]